MKFLAGEKLRRTLAVWPELLEVERAAAHSLLSFAGEQTGLVRVRPDRIGSLRALQSDREWTTGDIARLGNIWDRIMAGTDAPGILNAEVG